MIISQRIKLHWLCLVLILGCVISSCQTVSNTITPEPPVASLQSDSSQDDVEKAEYSVSQTSSSEKETTTTKKIIDKTTEKADEIDKKSLVELKESMIKKWLSVSGHGELRPNTVEVETTKKTEDRVTGKPDETYKRSFAKQEMGIIGKWLNLKETESIEFSDDGTILIGKEEGFLQKMKGKYRFVDDDQLRVDFLGDFYTKSARPMLFKVSIFENEITLIDEPDGTPTTYKRIK